ncbi:hypothetical protein WR25_05594, partial [Diploscapter pachys]
MPNLADEMTIPSTKADFLKHDILQFYVNRIGEYSFDLNRNMHLDQRSARFLNETAPLEELMEVDLNRGFDTFVDKKYGEGHIDVILEWLEKKYPKGGRLKDLLKVDIVCFRGTLARIGQSPYCKDAFGFHAVRNRDIIFLLEIKEYTDYDIATYRGYKFEQLMTVSDKGRPSTIFEPINRNEEYSVVYRSHLYGPAGNRIGLCYSAETDAMDNRENLLEFKVINSPVLDEQLFNVKAKRWWMQSYLTTVKKFYVGHRTEKGRLEKISTITLDALARKSDLCPNVCRAVLYEVLSRVMELLVDDGDTCTVTRAKGSESPIRIKYPGDGGDFLNYTLLKNFY